MNRLSEVILWSGLFSVGLGQSVVFVILIPKARDLGLSEVQVGMIFAFSAVCWMLMSPGWGWISDRIDKRHVFVLGLVGYALSLTLMATFIEVAQAMEISILGLLIGLIATRLLNGLFGSATRPAAMSIVAHATDKSDRGKFMASVESGFSVGTILGPAMAATLLNLDISALIPFYLFAALVIPVIGFTYFVLPNTMKKPDGSTANALPKSRKSVAFWHPIVMPHIVIGLVSGLTHATFVQTLGFFIEDNMQIPPEQLLSTVAESFFYASVSAVFAQIVIVQKLHLSSKSMLFGGLILATAGWLLQFLATELWMINLALAMHGMGFGLLRPGNSSLLSISVPLGQQGVTQGYLGAIVPIGHIISPIVIMPLYVYDNRLPYLLCALTLGALTVYVSTNSRFSLFIKRKGQRSKIIDPH